MSKIEGPSSPQVGGVGPKEEGEPSGNVSEDKIKSKENPLIKYFTKLADASLSKEQEKGKLTPETVMATVQAWQLSSDYESKFKKALKDTPSDQPLDSKTYKKVVDLFGHASYDRMIIQGVGKDLITQLQNEESQRKARESEMKQIEGQ